MTQSSAPTISLMVAMAKNRVIGRDNELPWRLKSDLQRFKKITMGKPIVMGRKTWESLGRPLPGRLNVVVSRQAEYALPEGAVLVHSIDEAIALVAEQQPTNTEVMVIGGAEIYQQALLQADRLYITHVYADVKGDAFFPSVNWNDWQEAQREDHKADPVGEAQKNPYDYSFVVYDRS